MALFSNLPKNTKLGPGEVDELARLLNNATRMTRTFGLNEALPQYLDNFRQLYMNEKLLPHPMATLHLICSYKNLQHYHLALDIAEWAMRQDRNYIAFATFGVIIEILALVDSTSQRCKKLYRDVLEHFPHGICSYDLSDGAILPDRSKNIYVADSIPVLDAILSARLIHDNWRKAYLTLDNMFRVRPFNIIPKVLERFIKERPAYESYQVVMMFARSGIFINPRSLMQLLDDLLSAQRIGGPLGLTWTWRKPCSAYFKHISYRREDLTVDTLTVF